MSKKATFTDATPFDERKEQSIEELSESIGGDHAKVYPRDTFWAIKQLIGLHGKVAADANALSTDAKKIATDSADHIDTTLAALTNEAGGDGAAAEVIQGRGNEKTIGDNIAKRPTKDELALIAGNDGVDVDGGIPDYMQSDLTSALTAINTTKFNLGFGTDYHYDIASNYNPHNGDYTSDEIASMWRNGLRKSLNITSLSTRLDAVVFGGDNVDSPDQSIDADGRTTMLKEQRDFANVVFTRSESPIFILKGNHDCNYYNGDTPSTIITDQEIATIYRQDELLFDEIRQDSGNYFYRDFADKKVRLIGLDSYDMPETPGNDGKMAFNRFTTSGFQQAQLDWLANQALGTMPAGYVALIALHHPVNYTLADDDDAGCLNHDVVKQILEDFVAGTGRTITSAGLIPATVTYTFNSAGIIAGVLSGHRHLDTAKTVSGINYIETRCSLTAGDNVDGAKRMDENGTANEDAFDVVTIDISAKTLTMTRVGAGSDDPTIATRKFNFGGDPE